MIPVTQTRTGPDGNCFAACLASLLETSLWKVTDFHGDGDVFLDQVADFLLPYGLMYLQVPPDDPVLERMFRAGLMAFHIIEGISPRGGPHAVVGLNGEMVWDPHPEDGTGRGLISVECFGILASRCIGPAR